MQDELIQEQCEICKRVVKEHMYENGYGGHSYGHKTKIVYEERRINLPERKYALTVLVCEDCIKNEPTLHSLILRKRQEWFIEKISDKRREIKSVRIEVQTLNDSIPKIEKEITELIERKKGLK